MSIGNYEPFWISDHSRHLYAALHRAPKGRQGNAAVVLVPPLLHEQHRSHRFLCELASGLSDLGIPSLRFAYFGTGDSGGTGEQGDLTSMASDIECAVNALRERSPHEVLAVIAFRSGTLPLHEWLCRGSAAGLAVLWDPVLDGAAWLLELQDADACKRGSLNGEPNQHRLAHANDGQLMGYAFPERLKVQLDAARWSDGEGEPSVPVWAVLRPDQAPGLLRPARAFALPADVQPFGTGTAMDANLTLSPRMENVLQQLGRAVLAEC